MVDEYKIDLLKDLVTQFQGQPKIEGLLKVIEKQMNDLCGFLNDLDRKRSLMTAEGKQLDGIGDIAVLSRGEAGLWACIDTSVEVLPDDDYRKYLIFKIWKNTNNTTYYDVQKAFRMFWDKPLYYKEDPDFPAVMLFETDIMKPGEMDVRKLFSLPIVRAAGVGIFIRAITQTEEIKHILSVGSHLGQGLTITNIPEWTPEWPDRVNLYVSAAMPRWYKTTITNDLTVVGLVALEDLENLALLIADYLPMLGTHDLTSSEDVENRTINIHCDGLTVIEDDRSNTLVITGG